MKKKYKYGWELFKEKVWLFIEEERVVKGTVLVGKNEKNKNIQEEGMKENERQKPVEKGHKITAGNLGKQKLINLIC